MALWTPPLLFGLGAAIVTLGAAPDPGEVSPTSVARCSAERFLPLGNGEAVLSETSLPNATDLGPLPPTYYAITSRGELYQSLAIPTGRGDGHRLSWKRLQAPPQLTNIAACRRDDGRASLFAVDASGSLWSQAEGNDLPGTTERPWVNGGSVPAVGALRCHEGTLELQAVDGQRWSRGFAAGATFERLSGASALSCDTQPVLRLPDSVRLWDGVQSLTRSCSWGNTLSEGSIAVSGRYKNHQLVGYRATPRGGVPSETLRCVERQLRTALPAHVTGSTPFASTIEPPIRMSSGATMRIEAGGRAHASLALHRDYGEKLVISNVRSDGGLLSTSVRGSDREARLYVAAPKGTLPFAGKLIVTTNVPAQPTLEIPVHALAPAAD